MGNRKDHAIRVGLAGLGRFGQLHAAVLAKHPGIVIGALADTNTDQLKRIASRYGISRVHPDAESMINDESLDAIILATPDEQHVSQAKAAIQRRKHLFVEKPLAPTWAEARELQLLAAEHQVYLQVGMILRFEAAHRWLHSQIQTGDFGALVSFRAQRNCSRQSYAAVADRIHTVHRTLIHDLDLLLWLSGSRVTSVMALDYREGDHLAPQGCFAMLELESGCIAQLESSWYVPDQAPANVLSHDWSGCIDAELTVVGTQRSAKLQGLHTPLQIWTNESLQRPDLSLWPSIDGNIAGALRDQMADFLDCVAHSRESDVADLNHAVEALRVADAIIKASHTRAPVKL